MSKRNRARRPARREAFREPKPVILVVTEGEATEPEYLRGFAKACHNPRVKVEISCGIGVPRTLVEFARDQKRASNKRALRERDENLRYDQVWCVFDIDNHPNVPDAREMARANEIELAISNPCIELWLWLHFAEQPGQQHRGDLQAMMTQHIAGYDKHVNYSDYSPYYESAWKRAKQLDSVADLDGDSGRNPTTGVWRLTESIRAGS